MTAEIAIMNKQAIAMAADSAVTIRGAKGQKIFTSANKIFTLSKFHAVGIMIYGNANLMGVPWETLVKIYRTKLNKNEFDTIEEYAKDFIGFLNKEKGLFHITEQEKYFKNTVYSYFMLIKKDIEKETQKSIDKNGDIPEKEIKIIVSKVIKQHYLVWKSESRLPIIPRHQIKHLQNRYGRVVKKAKAEIFEKLPVDIVSQNNLKKIAFDIFLKWPNSIRNSDYSGLVVAGFGKKDIFPSIESFYVEGSINNVLKYKKDKNMRIDHENDSTISYFAQGEMVERFMEGVDPDYESIIENFVTRIFTQYPKMIVDKIDKLSKGEKITLKTSLGKISANQIKEVINKLGIFRSNTYVNPVLNVVAMLPKDELAAMAESLVNLTSFKRKVSMEAETVGGPIDVAVISKGDGFIWIKRKHYFNKELNPQFILNYSKEAKDEK